jgi:hypothetical protein
MRKSLLVGSLAMCAATLLAGSRVLAADNWLGTWKLNVEKSKFSPGWPGPKSQTLKFEASQGGIRFTSDGVSAEGAATHSAFVAKYDGKEVPYEGNPNADTASPMKIDDNTYENFWRKGGKVTVTAKAVVSKDGKTLTISLTGKNAKGESVNTTNVYERQ